MAWHVASHRIAAFQIAEAVSCPLPHLITYIGQWLAFSTGSLAWARRDEEQVATRGRHDMGMRITHYRAIIIIYVHCTAPYLTVVALASPATHTRRRLGELAAAAVSRLS